MTIAHEQDGSLQPPVYKRPKDKMSEIIGEFGRWQLQKIAIVFIIGVPGLCHIYGSVFVAATSDFRCSDDIIDIPIDEVVYNKSLSIDTCSKSCEGDYIFDKSFWTSTLRIQWGLVCEKNFLATIGKMTLFAGFGAGTFGAGLISDNYGRKPAIVLMSQMLFGCGILASIMPNYISFVIVWFLTGVAAIGVYTVGFVWAMESVSGRWKTFVGMTMNFSWPIARFVVPLVAYVTRDWKTQFQVLSSLAIFAPLLMNYVPESPRWLLATNDKTKMLVARDILEKAAEQNGQFNEDTPNKLDALCQPLNEEEIKKKKAAQLGFFDIFRIPLLRRRALVMYYNWFVNSFVLYGLSLNWQSMTGSLFTNFMIGAALDFPAKTLAMILLIKTGRRWPYIICIFISGTAFLLMLPFERGVYPSDWPIVVMAMIGNLFVSTTFAMIWMYTPELFPTNIRNASLGSCSLVARIGGVLANLVGQLAEVDLRIPPLLFGTSALISAFLTLLLPETAGKPLPNTVEDCELYESKTRGIKGTAAEKAHFSSQPSTDSEKKDILQLS